MKLATPIYPKYMQLYHSYFFKNSLMTQLPAQLIFKQNKNQHLHYVFTWYPITLLYQQLSTLLSSNPVDYQQPIVLSSNPVDYQQPTVLSSNPVDYQQPSVLSSNPVDYQYQYGTRSRR